jgi:hypothetical protein
MYTHLSFLSLHQNSRFYGPTKFGQFPQMRKMTISKATFEPSTPCTIHFECLESGPNDSTRVRRLTGILRRLYTAIKLMFVDSQPSNSSQSGHTDTNVASFRPNEHVMKGGTKRRAANFRQLWQGIVSLLFVSMTKTRVPRTRVDLCYYSADTLPRGAILCNYPGGFGFGRIPGPSSSLFWGVLLLLKLLLRFSAQLTGESYYSTS